MNHLQLSDDELGWQKYLLQLHHEGRYEDMLNEYCHEGYHCWCGQDGGRTVGVCSHEVWAIDEREVPAATKTVAEYIKGKIEQGELGC